jgi:hypothetical protein
MTPALESTSIPAWAVVPSRPDADLSGRYWTVIAFADTDVSDWLAQIEARHPGAAPRVHRVTDDAAAKRAVTADLATALVGWRLMIAGPADACLRLRAHAVRNHVGDDEITVASADITHRDVHCAHCRTVTRAAVELEEVVGCGGCGRNLFVYYHVSRRIGAHLGFMT